MTQQFNTVIQKQNTQKYIFIGGTNTDQTRMPAIYISKYNRFVDNILGRVNKILRKSYDPVRVRLNPNTKKTKNNKKNNKKKTKKPGKKSQVTGRQETQYVLISTAVQPDTTTSAQPTSAITTPAASSTTPNPARSGGKNKRRKNTKGKKNKKKNNEQRARATLFGLSSIKRDGDVKVNIMSDHTTVQTGFLLGPLTLRVEKDFGRGAKKEIKSATATTEEMHGRLNLRIVHGGAATLHSIRVLQPKQVRVDSQDNHDRTREFVWKRSSHIARVVSEKLASATRSMLRPPPKNKK